MQLGLLLTYRCNARCAHCGVNSGPEMRDVMDDADVRSYVEQAAVIPYGVSALCLSGGEALLYEDLVVRTLRLARGRIKNISLITNAFWATSSDAATRKLTALREAGLTTLVVSASPFHGQFIRPQRVRTALAAADRMGMRAFIKCTTPADGPPIADVLAAVGPIPKSVQIDHMVFLPGGRASDLPMTSFDVRPGIPSGTCPGAVLTLHPNGDAYFCCTPGAESDPLRVGSAKTTPIAELVRAYYMRGVFAVLRERGPAAFVPEIRRAGLGHRLREGYVDVCHLCTSLMADPALSGVVREVSEARERATYTEVVRRTQAELATRAADARLGGSAGGGVA